MNQERDLLFAVLEAQKQVAQVEGRIAGIQPDLISAKETKDNAEAALMEFMEDTGKTKFRSSDFNVDVTKKQTLRASINKEFEEDAMDFIEEDCGRGDAIKKTPKIHHATLTSILQGLLEQCKPVPEKLFKLYFQKTLKVTPLKK